MWANQSHIAGTETENKSNFKQLLVGICVDEDVLVGAAAHAVVAGAVRAAHNDSELRHLRARHRRHHLRAVLRDPSRLSIAPYHKPYIERAELQL